MGIQDQRPSTESKSFHNQNSSTIKSYQSMTVFYKNADNLMNKRNELYHSITSVKQEIICITEILPKNASLPVGDCELQIQGFDYFTSNNKSLCHRGVLMYTKKSIKAVAVTFSELDYRDICVVNYHQKIVAYFILCGYTDLPIAQLRITTILIHLFQSFQN